MGNVLSKPCHSDQSSYASNGGDGDDLEVGSIDNGIPRRIRNESFLSVVRDDRNSSNIEDGSRLDNEDDQISLEDSASIPDAINVPYESSNDLHTSSERVTRPYISGNHRLRRNSFGNEFRLPPDPHTLLDTADIVRPPSTNSSESLYEDPGLAEEASNRQNEQINVLNGNDSVEYDLQQLINEISELMVAYDDDSVGDGNDSIDDLDISFENDTADSYDKRIYHDGNSCKVCFSEYEEKSHKRMILPCGHVICLNCVRKISKKNNYHFMKCPMDRNIHPIKVTISGTSISKAQNGDVE